MIPDFPVALFDILGMVGFLLAAAVGLANYRDADFERPVWLVFVFTSVLGAVWLGLVALEWSNVQSALIDQFSTTLQAVVIGLFAVGVVGTLAIVQPLRATHERADRQRRAAEHARADAEDRREALEAQNERLEQFASFVSHDLRNPLEIARGNLAIVREELEHDRLATIDRAHERMDALIEDLLTLAREGETVDDLEAVDLGVVAAEAWSHVDAGSITLRQADGPAVLADRQRLVELFENLFRNSVEHGEHTTELTVGALADRTGFYVADDGVGIDPADREAIFESGFSTNREGTGLGLAIVTDIAEGHGWTIDVAESDAGGARFEISGVEIVE